MQPRDLMKRILFLLTLIVIGLTFAGCHGNQTVTQDSNYIKFTVDGQTYTYTMGPIGKGTNLTGSACGYSKYLIDTKIYGSANTINTYLDDATTYIDLKISGTAIGTFGGNISWQVNADTRWNGSLNEVNITQYDAVNGRIKGTFSGVFTVDKDDKQVTGSFDVNRISPEDITNFLRPA